ncbi:MAG: thioredoxin domain-containing protein, partial [Nitrospinae bacterium]|nr:thioredoxin domain-containing protein [Nitrospinota bacterium]
RYSPSHWCHVMEHESFDDEGIAKILNEHFVSIKVDREERPDIDGIYMEAVQMMTGQGGWPMSVFLLPDLRPFFGGTYFPPDDKWGRPGFKNVLLRLAEVYRTRQDDLHTNAESITANLQQMGVVTATQGDLKSEWIDQAAHELKERFDSTWGGFGSAPKFPPSMALMLLLRKWKRFPDQELLKMVEITLQRMALGGMYDQLGGGFHRYSVDNYWLIPHFEKMLYDNALLSRVYLEAYQATGSAFYRSVVADTLDYVLREMTSPGGGFYSAQDADSEGEEGKFFVWRPEEIEGILGKEEADIFCRFYSVTEEGNFEGNTSALFIQKPPRVFAEELGITEEKLFEVLQRGRAKLFTERERRVKPGLDDKILTSWNGLMIGSMALAGRILEHRPYVEEAGKAADFIFNNMRDERGLLRSHREGVSKFNAYLDDYAFLIVGLVDLYEASFEPRWIRAASDLAREMISRYWDDGDGAFFFTAHDHEQLIVRKKMTQDGAVPSGNSMAALGLLKLAKLSGEAEFAERGEGVLRSFGDYLGRVPAAFHIMLVALDFYLDSPVEVAIVGERNAEDTQAVLRAVDSRFIPNKILAFKSEASDEVANAAVPLLDGKSMVDERATVYLCENYTCKEPLTDLNMIEKALERD